MSVTLLNGAQPASTNLSDGAPGLTLATRERATAPGVVEGLGWRFPDTLPTGAAGGSVQWFAIRYVPATDSAGTAIANGTFSNPTAGIWNYASFAPVAIAAGDEFMFEIWTPDRYVASPTFFTSDVLGTYLVGPADSPGSSPVRRNGRFRSGASPAFPSQGNNSCYFVDGVFSFNARNARSILVNGLRRLEEYANRAQPLMVRAAVADQPDGTLDVRYRFSSFGCKWRMTMFTDRVDSTSRAKVQIGVDADSAGLPYDPTGASVSFAFLEGRLDKPEAGDWQVASWDVTRIGAYVAQCNVGPGGTVALDPGNYYVWIKINDAAAGEIPAEQVAKLVVT